MSDNGTCFVSQELAEYLEQKGMGHTRGAPYHPMTQGKIERYHRSMKNEILLQLDYLPDELDREITRFVEYYNHHRYHESLNNVTPAAVYCGRAKEIEAREEKIKRRTLGQQKRYNQSHAQSTITHRNMPEAISYYDKMQASPQE